MKETKKQLITFLQEYSNIFAWSHEDMPSINMEASCHRLNIDPHHKSVKQKRNAINQKRYEAIKVKVDWLLQAGFIKETTYPDWVSNTILLKKANKN